MDVSYPAEAGIFRAEVLGTCWREELPPGWPGIGAIAGRQDAERFAAAQRRQNAVAATARRHVAAGVWGRGYPGCTRWC